VNDSDGCIYWERPRQADRRQEQAKQLVAMSAARTSRHTDWRLPFDPALFAADGDHIGSLISRKCQHGYCSTLAKMNSDVKHVWSGFIEALAHSRPPVRWINLAGLGELVFLLVKADQPDYWFAGCRIGMSSELANLVLLGPVGLALDSVVLNASTCKHGLDRLQR
jgi:hypothetical protein